MCRWGGCLAAMCVNIFTPFSAAEGAAIALLQSYGEFCCVALQRISLLQLKT